MAVATSTLLDQITAQTRRTVHERIVSADLAALERQAAHHQPRGFAASLARVAATGYAIIAECKKASPSKGLLCPDYDPAAIAAGYERAGAAAISVLTDEPYFQGSLADLTAVANATRIPVLRKDFMVDPFQMLEARAAGADAILLIVASHEDSELRNLAAAATAHSLDILCEVHDRAELTRAIDLGFTTIGVNCRDLKTMQMLPEAHAELAQHMPPGGIRVAESGIRTTEDLARLRALGYHAFLVGETLMRQPDSAQALATLIGRA
jgi:indole-3-glycerol phosphate synthase